MSSGVVIAGIYSDPEPVEHSPGECGEYVVLVNTGDRPVDMRGWSLTNKKRSDSSDHFRYHFPRFLSNGDPWTLEAGGMIFLYTGRGASGATATGGEAHQYHLFQHRVTRIWQEAGDLVCLYDCHDQLVHWWELPGVRRPA